MLYTSVMKKCVQCFDKEKDPKSNSYCRECQAERMRISRITNPFSDLQKEINKARTRIHRMIKKGLLKKSNCFECMEEGAKLRIRDPKDDETIAWLCDGCI